jgi:hypothetical protein
MTAETCLIPAYTQISNDPELASLALLEAALVTTRNSLQAHLPELGDPSPWHGEGLPDADLLLAAMILDRISELRDMVHQYRRFNDVRNIPAHRWPSEDDDIF